MRNWSKTEGLKDSACPWLEDRQEALRVAAFLKIPLYTLDFEREYQRKVLGYFFREYRLGHTPNPDVMCNKEIKFKLLYAWARRKGFEFLATGHYAKAVQRRGRWRLEKSADAFKDQTYFIYNLKESQLPHLLFPVGGLPKAKVRQIALRARLPNAERKESMGLCFVGRVRLKEFLAQELKPKAGPILNQRGEIIGQHEGLFSYTIGQRQGIRVGQGGPYFVVRKDLRRNALHVTSDPKDPALFRAAVSLHSVHWIGGLPKLPARLSVRYRHQGRLVSATLRRRAGSVEVSFARPQYALASGQSVVFYRGGECLGGGVIA